jgi:hypothetical protein
MAEEALLKEQQVAEYIKTAPGTDIAIDSVNNRAMGPGPWPTETLIMFDAAGGAVWVYYSSGPDVTYTYTLSNEVQPSPDPVVKCTQYRWGIDSITVTYYQSGWHSKDTYSPR